MNIHYIQHEPFEDLGCIREWLLNSTHHITHTHIFEGETFPDPNSVDFLIIMGGSMGANDDHIYEWLIREMRFISVIINSGKKVLGICLGAQILAKILRATVYPSKNKEIGWFPVFMTEQAAQSSFLNFFPKDFVTMHWHGDTFDIPIGASNIAYSECTPNQGFIFDNRVIGLQFHAEMTEIAILGMLDETESLTKDNFVQDINEIKTGIYRCEANNRLIFELLDKLTL